MNKLITILIAQAILVTGLFALNVDQTNKVKIAYAVGKTIKAKNGMTFEHTLPSIMGQESSWGVYVIGDKWDKNGRLKSVYMSSLGNFQIKLSTAKLTIRKYPHLMKKYGKLLYDGKSIYLKYEKHQSQLAKYKNLTDGGISSYIAKKKKSLDNSTDYKKMTYYSNIIENPKWIEREKAGKKRAIRTMTWAKRELIYHTTRYNNKMQKLSKTAIKNYMKDLKKYTYHNQEVGKLIVKANKDTRLINKLLNDFRFGAEVGGHYLLSMYEEAINNGHNRQNAYWKAIGRYNGGWNNTTYYTKVKHKMKTVKKVMRT